MIGYSRRVLKTMENSLSGSIDHFLKDEIPMLSEFFDDVDPRDLPYGLVIFERDGTVSSLCAPEDSIGEENAASVTLALDFVHYAFDRADWMSEFIKKSYSKNMKEPLSKKSGPQLTLIKGGLDESKQKD